MDSENGIPSSRPGEHKPERRGHVWTPEEDRNLEERVRFAGMERLEVARLHGRSEHAIRCRLMILADRAIQERGRDPSVVYEELRIDPSERKQWEEYKEAREEKKRNRKTTAKEDRKKDALRTVPIRGEDSREKKRPKNWETFSVLCEIRNLLKKLVDKEN